LQDLEGHPKIGASWEGFVINQLKRRLKARDEECFFWSIHAGAELDSLVVRARTRLGFEIKRTSSPKLTRSMRSAITDLKLSSLDVIHAGERTFALAENVRAVSIKQMWHEIQPLL